MGMNETATSTPGPGATTRVGERVRALRVAAGLTQSHLAAGRFSKEYISQIERGKTRPTEETIAWPA
jgi:transcriptional regulator with XRE-family HTH domain